ncbi:MAG: hypothetical protein ACK5ML_01100 [Lachnospiraceae bacterium]
MKKRILAITTAVMMTAGLLAGCGSSASTGDTASESTSSTQSAASESTAAESEVSDAIEVVLDGSYPEEQVIIGVEAFDTTDGQFLALQEYLDYLAESFNLKFMYSESLASAEDELNFINSCASAGAKAIIGYYNIAGEEAIQETIDLGMYYWGTEQYYDSFADNDMYLGCYTFIEEGNAENGDYLAGYEMGYNLGTQGVKHVFYCNGGVGFGIQMFIDRQAGFEAGIAAAQAEGAEIVFDITTDLVEGWPGTDDFTAAVGAKLAGDYDGVGSSFNAAALFQPIADAGKFETMKIATIGQVGDIYYDAVNSGTVTVVVYDCEEVVFGNAVVQILNAVTDNLASTREADGKAGKILVNRWTVTDAETYNAIFAYHDDGNYFVSAEEVASMLTGINANANNESISTFYGSLDIETALTIAE